MGGRLAGRGHAGYIPAQVPAAGRRSALARRVVSCPGRPHACEGKSNAPGHASRTLRRARSQGEAGPATQACPLPHTPRPARPPTRGASRARAPPAASGHARLRAPRRAAADVSQRSMHPRSAYRPGRVRGRRRAAMRIRPWNADAQGVLARGRAARLARRMVAGAPFCRDDAREGGPASRSARARSDRPGVPRTPRNVGPARATCATAIFRVISGGSPHSASPRCLLAARAHRWGVEAHRAGHRADAYIPRCADAAAVSYSRSRPSARRRHQAPRWNGPRH